MAKKPKKQGILCSYSLLAKHGSLAVHSRELFGTDGHPFDKVAVESILKDQEVAIFLKEMRDLALLPVERKK